MSAAYQRYVSRRARRELIVWVAVVTAPAWMAALVWWVGR